MSRVTSSRDSRALIAGLGPHGERAAPADLLALSEQDTDKARRSRFKVAAIFHTTKSDWAKQQLAGIVATLGRYAAAVIEVADCGFRVESQVEVLRHLRRTKVDAIISIPVGNGKIAAELLSPHVPAHGTVGILAHGVDFFVTNEREIAFRKWMGAERADVILKREKFANLPDAGPATERLLTTNPMLDGLFAVWDEPAIEAIGVLRTRLKPIPVTTIDLGNAAAVELACGDFIKGIGAQQPYDQGVAVATATVMALIGNQPPPWVALPGLAVTASDVVESYQIVWHAPAPAELIKAG